MLRAKNELKALAAVSGAAKLKLRQAINTNFKYMMLIMAISTFDLKNSPALWKYFDLGKKEENTAIMGMQREIRNNSTITSAML